MSSTRPMHVLHATSNLVRTCRVYSFRPRLSSTTRQSSVLSVLTSESIAGTRRMATVSKKRARSDSGDSVHTFSVPHDAVEWPASNVAMATARDFLQSCATGRLPTLLVPDKDADGLCGTMIIYRTLLALGLPAELMHIHFIPKGSNVHKADERERMEAYGARFVVVVDQGSRKSGPIVTGNDVKTLILDHHWSEEFPEGATILSAAAHPPIATSSTLAYMLCRPLLQVLSTDGQSQRQIDYLCAIGTYGDLGTSFTFASPWPEADMKHAIKKWGKKCLTDAVSFVNAPRRTATYDVVSAWNALLTSPPSAIAANPRLQAARAEVNSEINRCARNRPWFSGNGRVALIRVTSGAQIHPVIATRWTGTLKSGTLEIVMCANDGYLPGMTNFSCRVARCARERVRGGAGAGGGSGAETEMQHADVGVNIIDILREYASREPGLLESMGDDFARGHREASGGIVRTEDFERLWSIMQSAAPTESPPKKKKRKTEETQKNTLDGWVKRA